MRLTEWVNDSNFHEKESENLDIFLQIIRLLRDFGKGQGIISPALYEVDETNNVTYVEPEGFLNISYKDFGAPEPELEQDAGSAQNLSEKRDVFSLGMLLHYMIERKICYVNRPSVNSTITGILPFKSRHRGTLRRKKNAEYSAIKANDGSPVQTLMERMTAYDPTSRPTLKEVENVLGANICKFGIIPENTLTGERYPEITRSFTGSDVFRFIPEKEYVFNSATLTPISTDHLLIPFRLVKKQYILEVSYAAEGRWNNAVKKSESNDAGNAVIGTPQNELSIEPVSPEEAATVPKTTAALHFCDAVYGVEGHALFCETDGYTYNMGLYKHNEAEHSEISLTKEGAVAVPERLEARILSILREASITICDLYCVGIYGKEGGLAPDTIKALNDIFPEAIRIFQLNDDDLLKGAALYLKNKEFIDELHNRRGGVQTHEI